MKKDKKKIAGLLLAIACVSCVAGGVVAVSQPMDQNIVAMAATTEDLEKEFTNDGQFAVSQYGSMTYEFLDSTAEDVPEGASGAVMRITTVAGQAYVNVDFSEAQLKASDVNISVKVCSPDYTSVDEFRCNNVSVSGNIGKYDMSTWCDVPVDVSKFETDENGYLTTIYFGLRDKGTISTYFYIDSITVNMVEYTTYTFSDLNYRDWTADKNHIYLTPVGEFKTPADGNNGWTATFSYKDGVGVMLGETKIDGSNVKFPGSMFINLGRAPSEGEVLTVGGTFYNVDCAVQYVIPETSFKWNGTAWVEVTEEEPEIEYTTYTVTKVGATTSSTASVLNLYSLGGDELPKAQGDWNNVYSYDADASVKLNDTAITAEIKMPGDLYVPLGTDAQVGDIFTINGTFYNETKAIKLVFDNCKLQWNGTAWVEVTEEPEIEYTTYTVTKVGATSGSTASVLNLYSLEGDGLPKAQGDWNNVYSYDADASVKLNDTAITAEIKMPGDLYVPLGTDAQVGDIFTINGTFYNETKAIKLVFDNCKLQWNGTAWVEYIESVDPDAPVVEYTTYTFSDLNYSKWDATNKHLYLTPVGQWERPQDGNDGWTASFSYKDGVGVMLGETKIDGSNVKFPGSMFINLGAAPVEGDKVTIAGTFYNEACAVQYVIPETTFTWNGTTWEKYEDTDNPTEWQTFDFGKLVVHPHSSGSTSNVPNATALYIMSTKIKDDYPVNDWHAYFVLESGDGWKLNGEAFTPDLISADNHLYVNLANANVQVGDKLTVSGTFTYGKTKYVIEESTFVWNGTTWESYVAYETYELGSLKFAKWTAGNNFLYLHRTDGQAITPPSDGNGGWTATFKWKNGVGITLNDTELGMSNRVKIPQEFFIALPMAPEVGDVLKVGGTFYNDELLCAYIVEESVFQWDGTTWIPILEYTDYEVDALTVSGTQTSKTFVDLTQASGENFAVDGSYKFLGGSGAGVALNGEQIETNSITVSGNKLMVSLTPAADEGMVLTIGGKFYNVEAVAQYVIAECSFIFENGAWKVYESDYEEIGLGELKVLEDASNEQILYLVSKDESVVIPDVWDDEFTCTFGHGITMNGQAIEAIVYSGDNALCIELSMEAQEGDELVIGGKFVCDGAGVLYYVKESQFTWNGEIWEGVINYKTVELGKLTLYGNGSTTANKLYVMAGAAMETAEFDLTFESGIGFTVNGEAREATFKNRADGSLSLTFDGVENGDVVKIGGTFYNKETAIKYVIEESTFVWNDAWSVKYETVNVGPLSIISISSTAQDLYLTPSNASVTLPVADWEQGAFRLSSGNGITVNGQQIDMNNNWKSVGGNTMFVRLTSNIEGVAEGSIVVIEGTFRCDLYGYEYIFEETSFIYQKGVWKNQLDTVKAEAVVALDAYLATFAEGDYYATEWTLMKEIVNEAKSEINAAISKNTVETLFDGAKAAMDEVATKAEVDANFPQWKNEAKAELETYKDAKLYREAEQAIITATVAQAKADIDASTNWTDFNKIVTDAKAVMDALWTDAQWTAAEDVVTAAKDELASYKTESDYHAEEWATVQSIIAKANADVEAAIGNTTAIAEIVTAAKAKMDAVKTSAQVEAEEMVVLAAKAELEGYKTQSDYNEPEWNEIQTILVNAYAKLDEAIGDDKAIAKVIEDAKAAMDKVLKSEEANAKALEDAKEAAQKEIRAYANAINYDLYSEEAAAQISDYIAAALDAIEEVTAVDGFAPIVATMKANVESVEKLASANGKKGCGSVVGLTTGVTLVAAAAAIALRKKKEND